MFGLVGIFIGTAISTIVTVLWIQPYIVYRNLLRNQFGSILQHMYFMCF